MYRLFFSILLIYLTIEKIEFTTGLTWIPLKTGDKIPPNSLLIFGSENSCVGRSRHFDTVLPAEVNLNGTASVTSCNKVIPKDEFEVLRMPKNCQWEVFNDYEQVSENIVQGGTDYGGVPIYIGRSLDDDNEANIMYVYLGARSLRRWPNRDYTYKNFNYLSCKSPTKWVDTPSVEIPNNTVSGGKSEGGHEIFVARLKRDCQVVTGYVVPEIGTALAILSNGEWIQSDYCQVLIGEPNEYTWEACSEGIIPDNAVVHGKDGLDLTYIARWNNKIGHLAQSEAVHISDYDVLVKNEV